MDAKRKAYLQVALTILIWSGFIMVSRLAGRSVLSFWDVTALRFGTATCLLLPAIWSWRHSLWQWRMFALALTGGLGYSLLVYAAFARAPATHAAVLLPGMMPFLTSVVAFLFLSERPDQHRRISLVLAALGLACMIYSLWRAGTPLSAGDLLYLSASLSWSIYTVLLRLWQIPPWQATTGVASLSALLYLPIYVLFLPHHLHAAAWSAILLQAGYQGCLVVIVAMILYTRAVSVLGAVRVGMCMALVPGLAALLAIPLLAEKPSGGQVLALVLIMTSALQPWTWSWRRRQDQGEDIETA